MANKNLFGSSSGQRVPQYDAFNDAGGRAYRMSNEQALAQYAATGCLNDTFYATAEMQLGRVLQLCRGVAPLFIAKTALYTRAHGRRKDLPALLCALLTVEDPALAEKIFDRVVDDGKMLRNFVQIVRSGVVGRKSLGSLPKRLVKRWLAARDGAQIFRASVGQSPSLADVIKLAHPKPGDAERQALYAYLVGRAHNAGALPRLVCDYERYKEGRAREVPDVPMQMLTALPLGRAEWTAIARHSSWQQTRMNLNTFARHEVFLDGKMVKMVADRLRDRDAIRASGALPYQLLMAYHAAGEAVPEAIRDALQDAMEIAIGNVPRFGGGVFVCPDVSGSMSTPVTGYRRGATTAVRCIDVAALVAAAILRNNRDAEVLPFEHRVVDLRLNARDSVMTNASRLASVGGGGTNCSAPLALLNLRRARGELVIFVSDNESWCDPRRGLGTAMQTEWATFKQRNREARLVCIDLQPNGTAQAQEGGDVLNVGGFSDDVFELIARFSTGELSGEHWVGEIAKERIEAV
jgi:60 kDa SS-A/Ro ribonucleoprotein